MIRCCPNRSGLGHHRRWLHRRYLWFSSPDLLEIMRRRRGPLCRWAASLTSLPMAPFILRYQEMEQMDTLLWCHLNFYWALLPPTSQYHSCQNSYLFFFLLLDRHLSKAVNSPAPISWIKLKFHICLWTYLDLLASQDQNHHPRSQPRPPSRRWLFSWFEASFNLESCVVWQANTDLQSLHRSSVSQWPSPEDSLGLAACSAPQATSSPPTPSHSTLGPCCWGSITPTLATAHPLHPWSCFPCHSPLPLHQYSKRKTSCCLIYFALIFKAKP